MVVAKVDIPSLSVWRGSGYEIKGLYFKGVNSETGLVEEIDLDSFDAVVHPRSGHKKYLRIYNPRDHSERGPVVVSPEEIGLVTLKSELEESMLLAIPGFFWVFVAASFANRYTDLYGGTFWDAFFRT